MLQCNIVIIVSHLTRSKNCCTIDVWGIAINITLQDAPFLVFRLLLITHFQIISYMNVFFTCKNTLVILLQLYRLYVVNSELKKKLSKKERFELTNISIISKGDMCVTKKKRHGQKQKRFEETEESDAFSEDEVKQKKTKMKNVRKDTGYSTGSSYSSNHHRQKHSTKQPTRNTSKEEIEKFSKDKKKFTTVSERSESDESLPEVPAKKYKSKSSEKKYERRPTVSISSTRSSSE
ncbi:hypothetical protein HHI36_005552 [Cryptolaemus montrouzieri]|uniref:Uncharacterized protein n=1 Tax=Cryptolaemus montrouzieri TaxID=559131 RepID=A0ABD2NUG3_9CUCU